MPKYTVEVQSRDLRLFHKVITGLSDPYTVVEPMPESTAGDKKLRAVLDMTEEDAFQVRMSIESSVVKLVPKDGVDERKKKEDRHRVSILIGADSVGKVSSSNPRLVEKLQQTKD